ncbi:hypothetical protein SAMN05443543_10743 [Flavobacterium flevense]|uniref:Uncharacterized protein n=1 Tax=Flavobacterium flevense TaxID=983 RepID=A0A4Y4B0A7_9FLAO|nr:hypothetical protein [Flavobacterium flevense]GEC72710.1 hypothetical protein FFL01_22490 [Flavobacterium flevense]SHL92139.1 hypothetical protein SAMN05443543_10743 [Flavobacterium flevense]
MKFRLLFLILLITRIGYAQSEKLNEYKVANINNIITFFKEKNIDSISSIINLPLHREYPIPSIKNKEEFKQRFNEVFDKTIIDKIANSKIEQWSEVGWRGIMLDAGLVWINDEGKIFAVTYQSIFEKQLRKDLILKERDVLHKSLKIFESPTYKIKSKNYLIRIDKLSDYKYRYSSWKIGEQESTKPDIILKNGKWESEGSGGNHIISFSNGKYIYKVYRNIIGKDNDPDFTIEVEKNGKIILTEDGTLITE